VYVEMVLERKRTSRYSDGGGETICPACFGHTDRWV